METESVTCNRCGAPLVVPSSATYITCTHCGSHLAVRRTESVRFTEVVDKLSATAEQLADHVSRLDRQRTIESLDERWQSERQSYMIRDKHGHSHLPNEGMALVGGVAVVIFGCIWTLIVAMMMFSTPSIGLFSFVKFGFLLFGVVFVGMGILMTVQHMKKARLYREGLKRYQVEREKLLQNEKPEA